MATAFLSPAGRQPRGLFSGDDYARQRAFFAARPALAPTPLHALPALAGDLGIAALLVKDETARFGLTAFKAAGALFAAAALRDRGAIRAGDVLVCASEGNHGRAVARAAREAGCQCRVYMAHTVARARVEAIEAEGASVVPVDGTYDDAVRRMAEEARAHGWTIVSDTSTGDDDEVPRSIMLGYTRLMDEAEADWGTPPDLIVVPGGVGGLLGAVASWTAWRFSNDRPRVVAVEPLTANCLQVSARAGRPTLAPGPFQTVMGGLRCGEVSACAFDAVQSIVDAFVAIEDDWAFTAMRALAAPRGGDPRLAVGPSGAAALGGLMALATAPELAESAARLGLTARTRALVIASEGVNEPELFARIVG